ncbi:hypothetical protein F2Q70_00028741 [Brassica cretica]|uniref:Uncharacterized protein n=1 Tax=Brassica cretica TaxID=69181 RepID=A0A8S9LET5_BRACR|nr:hypothetical protein F2Q70_00028741 [Brassica cretica]KAF3579459.1 hypothetical protein DY000_02035847 [Brassica cretica]
MAATMLDLYTNKLINPQNEILDAFSSHQKKMIEALPDLQTKIAKIDEVKSLRRA